MIENILVISDTHIPFEKEGYMEFCYEQKRKYKCKKIIHIGDVIDNSASGRWDANPDNYSAGDELQRAKKTLEKWYKLFPKVSVCIGNHEGRIIKKMFTGGISSKWLKSFSEVLGVNNWEFQNKYIYGNILFIHGDGVSGTSGPMRLALDRRMSVVCGHQHTLGSLQFNSSGKNQIFSMVVGCGINKESIGFLYARNYIKEPVLSAAVILENGTFPILIPFK